MARFFWPPESSRERPLEVGLVEAEARERLVDLRDHLVAALVLEAVREGVVAVVQRRRVVALGHPVLEPAQLGLDRVEVREGAGREVVQLLGQVRLGRAWSTVAIRTALALMNSPASGSSRPSAIRRRVVLPAPLRPTRPTFSPGLCCQVASRRTTFGP